MRMLVARRAGDGLQLGADGRRVSTRQRQKPMEFWRNERVEYARDHRSEWQQEMQARMPAHRGQPNCQLVSGSLAVC